MDQISHGSVSRRVLSVLVCISLWMQVGRCYGQLSDCCDPVLRASHESIVDFAHADIFGISLEQIIQRCDAQLAIHSAAADRAQTFEVRADAYFRKGQFDRAAHDYLEALKLEPGNLRARSNYAMSTAAQGETQEAIRLLTEALDKDDGSAAAHAYLATIYNNLEQWDEAVIHATKAIEIDPDYARPYVIRGAVRVVRGQYQVGLDDLNQFILLCPFGIHRNGGMAYRMKGNALVSLNRLEEGVVSYQASLHLEPDSYVTIHNLHVCYMLLGQYGGARVAAERMAFIEPNTRRSLRALAASRVMTGSGKEAVEPAEKLAELDPESAEVRLLLATTYRVCGRIEDARTEMAIAHEMAPESYRIRFAHALFRATCPDSSSADVTDAIDALETLKPLAIERSDENWFAGYAMLLALDGKRDKAAELILDRLEAAHVSDDYEQTYRDLLAALKSSSDDLKKVFSSILLNQRTT